MSSVSDNSRSIAAVILAAGKGTRMQSDLPKVMHEVADRPMVHWVVDAVRNGGLDAAPIVLVVGYQRECVEDSFAERPEWLEFAVQAEQLGTGPAIDMAAPIFADAAVRSSTDVFVLCGDGPLIRTETLDALLQRHRSTGAAATLATARLKDPDGYGRIQRNDAGGFDRIVEQKDATDEQRSISEINPSYYVFRADALFDRLSRLKNDNASGEYYITDVFQLLQDDGLAVEVIDSVDPGDVLSINDPAQLAVVDSIMRNRLRHSAGTEVPQEGTA
ncbi:MAG: sugar phosphate nucleotidyltransferase [Planctomycetota bacterium]|nr:sugar phosphate nucleotidyltransferase [Planctomycetota bacterium]